MFVYSSVYQSFTDVCQKKMKKTSLLSCEIISLYIHLSYKCTGSTHPFGSKN